MSTTEVSTDDLPSSRVKESAIHIERVQVVGVAELSTDHLSFFLPPVSITHCVPATIITDLHSPLPAGGAIDQLDISIGALRNYE